jgi:hypothetical protein
MDCRDARRNTAIRTETARNRKEGGAARKPIVPRRSAPWHRDKVINCKLVASSHPMCLRSARMVAPLQHRRVGRGPNGMAIAREAHRLWIENRVNRVLRDKKSNIPSTLFRPRAG